MYSVLIVDDEEEIVELIEFYMKNNGYRVHKAYNGKDAIEVVRKENIDIIILDIMMPGLNGKEVLKNIRRKNNMPIIFLSAKGEDIDKIEGLFLGADDYMSKPFNPMELIARVNALLRRSSMSNNQENIDNFTTIGCLKLDEKMCKVYKNGIDLKLTAFEYKLMSFFMKNKNRVFTKAQLYEQVWQMPYLEVDSNIMVYISKLRIKIEDNPKEPKFIKTVKGLGYVLEEN